MPLNFQGVIISHQFQGTDFKIPWVTTTMICVGSTPPPPQNDNLYTFLASGDPETKPSFASKLLSGPGRSK